MNPEDPKGLTVNVFNLEVIKIRVTFMINDKLHAYSVYLNKENNQVIFEQKEY